VAPTEEELHRRCDQAASAGHQEEAEWWAREIEHLNVDPASPDS
jgi:hypothetical protein